MQIKIPKPVHGQWSSAGVFVLAATGFAIGLKNIWQFPYHAGLYGGGAFILVYVCFLFLLGVPLLMTQVMLGRLGRQSPVGTMRHLVRRARVSHRWVIAGGLSVAVAFLILSYYSAIAGWLLAYLVRAVLGGLAGQSPDGAGALFAALIRDPEKQLFWYSLFIFLTMVVTARGVRQGIEVAAKVAVPVLLGLLVVLAVYAVSVGELNQSLRLFLAPDFTRLSGIGLLTALGDAFFSLGLGVGVMLLYGAYLPADVPIARVSVLVVAIDCVAGILGGLIVFPVALAAGPETQAGAGLVFQSLVVAFDGLPGGGLLRVLFFFMLVLVAWMSSIAFAELVVAWLVERFALTRVRAAALTGAAAWVMGVATILSFNYWRFTFPAFGQIKTYGFFDLLQILTSSIMLPVIGLLLALFGGWVLKPATTREILNLRSPCAYDAWLWLTRLAVPVWMLIVLVNMRLYL
jgi:neurotransmitter:Na+ symporter, NSS family